jgi:hypothetical protein
MLRGHIAHQRSGRRRVLSSINAGATRLYVRLDPMAYVMATSSGPSPTQGAESKACTCVSTEPLHNPRSFSFRNPAGVRTYPGAPDLYVYRGPVTLSGGPVLLRHGAYPRHMAPFGPPIRWS